MNEKLPIKFESDFYHECDPFQTFASEGRPSLDSAMMWLLRREAASRAGITRDFEKGAR